MNCRLYRIQVLCGRSVGFSDDLINFWKQFIKNKMTDGENLKVWPSNRRWARYLRNRWLDHNHISGGGSLGISDLIYFREESFCEENKMADGENLKIDT